MHTEQQSRRFTDLLDVRPEPPLDQSEKDCPLRGIACVLLCIGAASGIIVWEIGRAVLAWLAR